MPLLAVPNLSEARDSTVIRALQAAVTASGAKLLDTHQDATHNRTVLTVTAPEPELMQAMLALAESAARLIDLRRHEGVHPRVGVLDVCPFVPFRSSMDDAVRCAERTAERIGETGLPVFLYGPTTRLELPDIRRGGLVGLTEKVEGGLLPDFGPAHIRADTGVVCVGARGPLIAFNVNIDSDVAVARSIARDMRAAASGLDGLRALGLPMNSGAQVSINITRPEANGIDEVFDALQKLAEVAGARVTSTEIVGLVEERFMPDPDAQAARLLIEPGRSVESALKS